MNLKKWMVGALVLMSLSMLAGCSNKPNNDRTQVAVENEEEGSISLIVKEKRVVIDGDWLFMEYIESETPWLYFDEFRGVPEIDPNNEGGARYNVLEGLISFSFAHKTESEDYLFAEIDFKGKEVVQKEQIGDWNGLSDERILEIGDLFLEIFHAQSN